MRLEHAVIRVQTVLERVVADYSQQFVCTQLQVSRRETQDAHLCLSPLDELVAPYAVPHSLAGSQILVRVASID